MMTETGEHVESIDEAHVPAVTFTVTFDELECAHRALQQHAWDLSDRYGRSDLRTITARALAARIGATRVLAAVVAR